jgi:hypothetical protein
MNWETSDRRAFRLTRAFLLLVVLFVFTIVAPAQQRPLLTEDPRITPAGSLISETGIAYLTRARFPLSRLGGNELQLPIGGLHFNLGDRAELQLTSPLHRFLWVHENGTGTRNDWGDGEISTKIRIFDEKGHRPIVGFRPTVVLPNSNDEKGIGTDTTQFFARLLFGKHFGSAFIFGNAGIGLLDDTIRPRSQQDVFVYGVAALVPVSGRTSLAGEVNGVENPQENPTPGGEDHAETRLGIQVRIAGFRLDAAATAGLTRNDHRWGFVSGVSKEFRLWK